MISKPIIQCILAAGRGQRLGQTKALLSCHGKTLIEIHMERFNGSSLAVLGHSHQLVSSLLHSSQYVLNENWSLGQFSSVQKALSMVPPGYDALILPVDQWPIDRQTYNILSNSRRESFAVIQPKLNNQNGHPILISEQFISELLHLPSQSRMDHIIHKLSDQLKIFVDVQDPAICKDLDTISDLISFREVYPE